MAQLSSKSKWMVPLVAMLALAADYASKRWALVALHPGITNTFIPGLLNFTLVTNTGTAFGMWQQQPFVGYLLPPLICLSIVIWIINREAKGQSLACLEQVSFGLILGGALGNMVDRLMLGQVTDFIYFAFFPAFPVFNLADALIDVGVALLIIHTFIGKASATTHPGEADV